MKFVYLLAFLSSVSALADNGCDNYCVGVRGNGEAEPAHLGALSRMVEDYSMPKAMAGGSSATVTMFLAEQVKKSPVTANVTDAERKRKIQALMIKSMPEFEAAMTADAKVAEFSGLAAAAKKGDFKEIEKALDAFSTNGQGAMPGLKEVLGKYGKLLNPELVRGLESNPARFVPEAKQSIKQLGAFDGVHDDTLFFRPGLVDFKSTAVVLGYMADFYAGNTDGATKAKLDKYFNDCADPTFHKEWMDAPEQCRMQFRQIAADYLAAGNFQNKALFDKVSAGGDVMPTTSILQGQSLEDYNKLKSRYQHGMLSTAAEMKRYKDWSANFKNDVKFGYWGKPSQLAAVDKGLEKYRAQGDVRAEHFKGLGDANWFDVLSVSPAEPGIANAQQIPMDTSREQVLAELQKPESKRWLSMHYRPGMLSVGGWDDLQPTEVMKQFPGCDRTLFLTRSADYGDSRFGQQVMVRIAGEQAKVPFWEHIGDGGPGGWCDDKIKAAGGNPDVVRESAWNQLANLCNPNSSFRRALDVSDGSYCTDWDNAKYEVFDGLMREAVKNAYEAPMIPSSAAGSACRLNNPPSNAAATSLPGCIPYPKRQPGGGKPVPEEENHDSAPGQ
jgi:hypothetical protein